MIKKFKYCIILLFVMLVMTGCSTSELNMNIDKDGNVLFKHIILVNNDDFEITKETLDIVRNEFSYGGFDVKKIVKGSMTGYEISKSLGNLNSIDSNNNEKMELTEYGSSNFNDKLLFSHKKRFFSDKFVANFTIDLTDMEKATEYLPILQGISYNFDKESTNIMLLKSSDDDIIRYNKNIDTFFTLNSSLNVSSHNADKDEKGVLTWNLKYGQVNEVNFEVVLMNRQTILLTFVLLFIAVLVYLVIVSRNNKIRRYNKVSVRESLDYENRTLKKAEYKDIKYTSRHKKVDEKVENELNAINERLRGNTVSLGAYDNVKTVDEISKDLQEKKIKITPLSEEDPTFKRVEDQIENSNINEEEKEKEEKKFLD